MGHSEASVISSTLETPVSPEEQFLQMPEISLHAIRTGEAFSPATETLSQWYVTSLDMFLGYASVDMRLPCEADQVSPEFKSGIQKLIQKYLTITKISGDIGVLLSAHILQDGSGASDAAILDIAKRYLDPDSQSIWTVEKSNEHAQFVRDDGGTIQEYSLEKLVEDIGRTVPQLLNPFLEQSNVTLAPSDVRITSPDEFKLLLAKTAIITHEIAGPIGGLMMAYEDDIFDFAHDRIDTSSAKLHEVTEYGKVLIPGEKRLYKVGEFFQTFTDALRAEFEILHFTGVDLRVDTNSSSSTSFQFIDGLTELFASTIASNYQKAWCQYLQGRGEEVNVSPWISVYVSERKMEDTSLEVVISIEDHGPGFDPKILEKGFMKGLTIWSADGVTGTGLGLAALRQAMAYVHGTIALSNRLTNEPGSQSKYIFPVSQ